MGTKYSTNAISGYNSSPPADDGSVSASNQVTWAKHKAKLADPIKTLAEAINSTLVTALDYSATARSSNYTTAATDHQKPILCTNSITVSLLTASSAGLGYQVTVVNAGTGTVTVGLLSGTDTLDGTTNGTIVLQPGQAVTVSILDAATGYRQISKGGGAWIKVGSTTRDISTATGTQAITGVGFKPKAVILFVNVNATSAMSVGFSDASTHAAIYDHNTVAAGTYAISAGAIVLEQSGTDAYTANIDSMDADGFTIGWTKTGSTTGTATIKYLAIR